MAEFDEVRGLAERFEDVYCSVGVHPNDSGEAEIAKTSELVAATHHPKVIGIGETGLDYHYERTNRELQKQSFLAHCQWSRSCKVNLLIC
jgi:TatD DNase family protein